MVDKDDLMTWVMSFFFISAAIAVVSHNSIFEAFTFVTGIAFGVMLIYDNFTK